LNEQALDRITQRLRRSGQFAAYLMAVFGLATLLAAGFVLRHLLTLHDPQALLAWKEILVTAAPWTLSICSLPFAVSKTLGSLEGIISSLSKRKDG